MGNKSIRRQASRTRNTASFIGIDFNEIDAFPHHANPANLTDIDGCAG
jgi:hypothetical protein